MHQIDLPSHARSSVEPVVEILFREHEVVDVTHTYKSDGYRFPTFAIAVGRTRHPASVVAP
jgi:hypothetical protein